MPPLEGQSAGESAANAKVLTDAATKSRTTPQTRPKEDEVVVMMMIPL